MRSFLKILLTGVLMLWMVTLAFSFPTKPVTIIVPWSAGGATDILFRLIAEVFPKYANGQPLVIKNIPGGGAVPGTLEFLKSKPDGYTLFSLATPIITKIHWSEVTFTADDFEPVINIVYDPSYLLVNAKSPFKNLTEFLEYAKANPGVLTVGNGGYGGGNHLVAVAFEDFAGVKFMHVPFDGGAPAITALVGGHVAAVVAAAPEGVPQVQAGQLRVLAVFSDRRLAVFPDVPTAMEQGVNFVGGMWRGVAVPKGTPPEIVKALHDIFRACMNDPDFIKKAREQGFQLYYLDSEAFKNFVKQQDAFWRELMMKRKLGEKYSK